MEGRSTVHTYRRYKELRQISSILSLLSPYDVDPRSPQTPAKGWRKTQIHTSNPPSVGGGTRERRRKVPPKLLKCDPWGSENQEGNPKVPKDFSWEAEGSTS